ncbi:unnamed protein product [Kuraishia capsulata CBS 1993]|uniref:Endoribonuclease YSH1 n=1 Tax=Kuraishia capsulata CBS 1993 TaxID=1382522 RepID=W6MF23_9ASCO|nr:uncharacterized protein KUCA_T00000099001 [Kuraishia capsulata CBS 1993]CDK24139.1 unnamed protein product [Kuraishia capsulata CBS 1993]
MSFIRLQESTSRPDSKNMATEGEAAADDGEAVKFVCLGGGNEVGRSCHIVQYKDKTIMLDAGVHPAYNGLESLPFYDEFDLSKVDILLITHFHLDHAASLPYVMRHTNFKGRVFMTYPTKAIYRWLLNDFVRVTSIHNDKDSDQTNSTLYTDADLNESFDRIEPIDFHSTIEVDGIRFTAYHAGHVLGAAMYFVEIGGIKFLFTGDYSREEDRHLASAEVPPMRPDLLITESTFGTATHVPRIERETRLMNIVHATLAQGGRCLLPVFALGRAQEILLILDEYWETHKDLERVPIFYASDLAKRCMAVYQRYVNMMNENIRKAFTETNKNPFEFKHIKSISNLERFDDLDPCVILASPGMLQSGFSREILERWAPNPLNSLIMTGYSVEGTMAKDILTEPSEIPSAFNSEVMIPRRMNVEEISFAAHVDYEQNAKFIELVNPKAIILVHGESRPMGRLKSALLSKYQKFKNTDEEVKIYNPKNGAEVNLKFRGVKIAHAMGIMAEEIPKEKKIISGVLVQKDFDLNLLKLEDLREYSGLTTTIVRERQVMKCCAGRQLIHWHLSQMFGYVEMLADELDEYTVRVMDSVIVTLEDKDICTVQWSSGMMTDAIADSVIAILMSVDSSPVSVKMSSKPHTHSHDHEDDEPKVKEEPEDSEKSSTEPVVKKEEEEDDDLKVESDDDKSILLHTDASEKTRIKRIVEILRVQFGDSLQVPDADEITGVTVDIAGKKAEVDFSDMSVVSESGVLKGRIESVLTRAGDLVAPLAREMT